ncbi:MAG: hypothetical protein QM642_04875 [Edaphocola sp.]
MDENTHDMLIVVDKNTAKKEVKAALKKIGKKSGQPKLSDFFGKLKGAFGDGLTFQKKLRNEWD